MCQLLGMNCNVPTDICFSFDGFSARGGKTDTHQDGWGISFFEGKGCRIFVDDQPSISSPIAQLVKSYPIHSTHVIAHIRKATQGRIALENCHPFGRELWGRYWVFAHNGDLSKINLGTGEFYQPVGDTDSEKAFCIILDVLRQRFPLGKPPLKLLYEAIAEVTASLSSQGIFNYLLSDGESFFAHCSSQLYYVLRQAPFAAAHLIDMDLTVDFSQLTRPSDRVAIIATVPLTDNEVWTPFQVGQLLAFQDGVVLPVSNDNSVI